MKITLKHWFVMALAFFAAWLAHVLGFLTVMLSFAMKFPVELTLVVGAITLIVVLGIWLAKLFRPEPGSAAGFFPGLGRFLVAFWGHASWFISAFLAALVVHTGLAYVFDSTLFVLGGVEVFKDAIMEPGTIPAELLKELLVLVVCYSVFTLWYKSNREHRPRLYKWTIAVSVVLLVAFFAGFDWKQIGEAGKSGVASVEWKQTGEKIASVWNATWDYFSPQADPRVKEALRQSEKNLKTANAMVETSDNQRKAITEVSVKVGLLDYITIPKDFDGKVYMFGDIHVEEFKINGETVEQLTGTLSGDYSPDAGSEWLLYSDQTFYDPMSKQFFLRLADRVDTTIIRWMQQTWVDEIIYPEISSEDQPIVVAKATVKQPVQSTASLAVESDLPDHVRYPQFSAPQEEVFVTTGGYVGTELYIEQGDLVVIRASDNGLLLGKHLESIQMKSGYARAATIGMNYPNDDEMAFGLSRVRQESPPIMLAADGKLTKSCIRLKLSRPIAGQDGLSIMVIIVRQGEVEKYLANLT